jgi:uncharacterized protein involved in exopolysaccharide biosynthesis
MNEEIHVIEVKDISRKMASLSFYLKRKFFILLIAGAVGGLIGFLIALTAKPTYVGSLTFVLSSGKSSDISGLANQFGFDFGNSNNDIFSGDNILALFTSKRMVQQALFKKLPGQNEILANLIVREWGWDDVWKKNTRLKGAFPFPTDITATTGVQDSLLREIHDKILEKNLAVSRLDKKLSIYTLKTTSSNQLFSCYLTRYLMYETANFYINTKTSVSRTNLQMLQHEADSLKRLLGYSITSTASQADATYNLNPAMQVQRSSVQKGQVNTTVIGTAYGEVVKNLELARINLQKEMPLYQILDEPSLPLKLKKESKFKSVFVGFFLAFVPTLLFLILARLVKTRQNL